MIVLGLHFGHDSSIAVIKNGKPLICVEIERLHRIKHAIGITPEDILKVLKKANINKNQVDYCAITSTQHIEYLFSSPKKFSFKINHNLNLQNNTYVKKNSPNKKKFNYYITKLYKDKNKNHPYIKRLTKKFKLINKLKKIGNIEDFFSHAKWNISNGLDNIDKFLIQDPLNNQMRFSMQLPVDVNFFGKKIKGWIFSHHFAHAAYTFYNSPFSSSTILTQDGSLPQSGYWCGMIYYGKKNKLYPVMPHYLNMGKLYEVVSVLLGFNSEEGPGKMMGLAPYGKPNFFNKKFIGNIFDIGKIKIQKEYHKKHFLHKNDKWSNKWIKHLINMAVKQNYNLSPLGDKKQILEKINVDIASSTQKLLQETIVKTIRKTKKTLKINKINPTPNLCLSGGTILNCPANSKIFNSKIYNNLFVPPAVHDGGLSIGSAQAVYYNNFNKNRLIKKNYNSNLAYLGFFNTDSEVKKELIKFKKFIKYRYSKNFEKIVAKKLSQNKVIAIVYGRSEIGPRALGHRSILSHPGYKDNWEKINKIKKRELWRPFAPAVLLKSVSKYFYYSPKNSPFMLFTSKVKSKKIPAVTHVDNSSRIQTVDKNTKPLFKILNYFKKFTGLEVIMNTSFNGPGEPIVETTSQAIKIFLNTDIDFLVVNNYLISKKNNNEK